jgi:hypothetical protein
MTSMLSDNERDKRLDSFDKTFSKDLDDTVERQKKEIEQRYKQEFTSEMNQAEECAKKLRLYWGEIHRLRAEMLNDLLKQGE